MGNWQSTGEVVHPNCACVCVECFHTENADGGCVNVAGYDSSTETFTLCEPCESVAIDLRKKNLSRLGELPPTRAGIRTLRCPCVNNTDRCTHDRQCWKATTLDTYGNPRICTECYDAFYVSGGVTDDVDDSADEIIAPTNTPTDVGYVESYTSALIEL